MRYRLTFAIGMLVTGLVAWTAAQKLPADYTQWRGQARDGSASAFTEPSAWPEALTQRWRTDVGLGYATPLVVGDRLYVFSRRGDNEVMSALDAATGKTIWETPTPVRLSNPVLVGDTLFGLSTRNSGQYFAVDVKTGQTVWTSEPRQAAQAAVVKAGPIVFSLEDDGELVVGRVGTTAFEPLRRYKVADSETWTQPTISGNRLFVKDVSTLTLWTIP